MNHTSGQTSDNDRRAAWTSAKLAVRSYAREPSDNNAGRVESALRQVRDMAARAANRRLRGELSALESQSR